jgi:hypothetical protein
MYWAMQRGNEVELWRAALDGTGAERVLVTTTTGSTVALLVVEE